MRTDTAPESPRSWKQVALSDIAEFSNGKPYESFVDASGRNLLITLDSVDIYGQLKPQHRHTNVQDYSLKEGDIVTVLSDIAHGYLLGLSAQIPKDGCYVLNQRMGRLRTNETVDPAFLRLWINAHQLHFRNRGQGTSQRHIYKRDFYSLMVSVPPLNEQKAIVESVTNADYLVKSLELLIAKKRDIKQGAMQQLLTGKTRLPGFAGDWKETTLGDPAIAVLTSGGTPSTTVSAFWNGNNHWVTPTDITATKTKYLTSTSRKITNEGLANSSAQMLPVGTLLLCSRATVGEVRISQIPVCTNQGFKAIVAAPGMSNEFLYYKLLTMRDQMLERSFGSTFLELPMREAKALPLQMPSAQEQCAIAEILSDMDSEIEALLSRREKTIFIKTGMMQELLTGRTRLL